jgi:hypothetical protein
MNEEKINLVLMDICGRLPHGVITKNCKNNFDVPAHMLPHVNGIKLLIAEYDLKPYLRPMSSMTAAEEYEYHQCKNADYLAICKMEHAEMLETAALWFSRAIDWLNKHGFDYRGLIPMGLALPATEGMYK